MISSTLALQLFTSPIAAQDVLTVSVVIPAISAATIAFLLFQFVMPLQTIRSGSGTAERPYKTISKAAKTACPGDDEVIVAPGTYREYVDSANSGMRIVYHSEVQGKAVIT